MSINILEIQPNKVSRNLASRRILIYGKPKIGKTTFAASGEKVLLIATEMGYSEIPNVVAQDIFKWTDFKLVVRQLTKPEAREMYDVIAIDVASILYDLCEKYICQREAVSSIGEVPYGAGWGMAEKEFFDTFQILNEMKYGVIFIAHEKVRVEKSDDLGEREVVSPDLSKRAYNVINRMVDIIAYIGVEYREGVGERYLYTRGTRFLVAGSRNPFLPERIKFGYDELVAALNYAIDEQEKLDANSVATEEEEPEETAEVPEVSFQEMMSEARTLWETLVNLDEGNAGVVLKIIEKTTGKAMRLSQFTEENKDILNLILFEMRELVPTE